MEIKIGVAQISNNLDLDINTARILESLSLHQHQGTHLLLFPECALTGFSVRVRETDFEKAHEQLRLIQSKVDEGTTSLFLPAASRSDQGGFYNSIFLLRPKSEPISYFKEGLTPSEQMFFLRGTNQSRIIDIAGFKIGFLICIEAAHEPWKYLNPTSSLDLILWPGYWNSSELRNWNSTLEKDNLTVYQNFNQWRVPLIQATFFINDGNIGLGDGPFGCSIVVCPKKGVVYHARKRFADHYSVTIQKTKTGTSIRKVRSLVPETGYFPSEG